MVLRSELLYRGPFREGHIVFVGRNNFVEMIIGRLFYHSE